MLWAAPGNPWGRRRTRRCVRDVRLRPARAVQASSNWPKRFLAEVASKRSRNFFSKKKKKKTPTRAKSVRVARQLAIEHPHHRFEEQALALRARMAVVLRRRLQPRDDFLRQHLDGAARCPSPAPARGTRARACRAADRPAQSCFPGHQHAVVLHEHDLLVADHSRQALTLLERIRGPGVVVVVGDVAVEERRGLAGRQQAVVLQHVERERPRSGACAAPRARR